MGDLPADRVQPARPFINSGVDFCGPVFTHFKIRGKRPKKAYIAVFCCFATKAVHLELVSDLSTEGFLGALRRFISRRGHCRKICCDNATNFIGARNQLIELRDVIHKYSSKQKITIECSTKGIDFHFILPRAPHFGGLWEAAVKSAKHLLQHSLSSASLIYDEMETVIIEAEAILNLRPITPLSSDPNDLAALATAHFLIAETLTTSVDPQAAPISTNLQTRWKLVASTKNEFWRRWSLEYLNQLQNRYKWKQSCANVKAGTMVIIQEDNLPPLKWPLGRITKVIKGKDGLVRVAEVKTARNTLLRPICRLAPLPIEKDLLPVSTNPEINQGNNHNDQDSKNPTETPKKKSRLSLGSTLVTLLLACLILPTTSAIPADVTYFETNPGIYFENLGSANTISSEWNIITYYDMQPYWKEIDLLHNCSLILSNIAVTMRNRDTYKGIATQIKHVITELDQSNDLLQITASTRTKRGAFNIIGNIANSLFGVLDSNYAEEMSATIEAANQNQDHIMALLRNQTTIVDATINVMQRNHQAIEAEFTKVESHLSYISSQIDSIHDQMHEGGSAQAFSALALQTLLTITNFQRTQNLILDALANTQQGKLSRHLISPNQLKDALTLIRGNLPSTLKLPMKQDDILKFYNIISIEGRTTSKHIIFKLRLPLLSSEDFELFKLTPVPVKINNTFAAIKPGFPFLIVNMHRDQYYPLAEPELRACVLIDDKYLCNQPHPLYKIGSSVSACEIKLLNQMERNSMCQIIKTESQASWIQMHNPNHWIFSLERKTTVNLVCGENMTQLVLQDAGILKIDSNCIIKQPLVTIRGHQIYSTNNRASYIPSLNLTDVITPHNLTHALRYQHHYSPHLNELETIKQQIQNVNEHFPKLIRRHTTHQFTLGYISLAIIIIIVIVLIWQFKSTLRSLFLKTCTAPVDSTTNHEDDTSEGRFTVNLDT